MKRIGIAGLGGIGHAIAQGIDQGIAGVRLVAVASRNPDTARSRLQSLSAPPAIVPLDQIAECADIVIECGGAALLHQLAPHVLRASKQLWVLSTGALIDSPKLRELAHANRAHIRIPSGAIGGLDAIAAMAQGVIYSAKLTTRKPPSALRNVSWLTAQGIDPMSITAPVQVFSGTVMDAVHHFPSNLNVAATLALCSIGEHRTMVEIWIDPTIANNHHSIEVNSDSGTLRFSVDAIASSNPASSTLAARSALALLHKLNAPLQVG